MYINMQQQSGLSTDLLLLHSASSQSKVSSAVTSSVDKDNPTNSNCCENTKTSCECGNDLDEIDSLLKQLLALDSTSLRSKSNVACEDDSCRGKKSSKRRELVIDKLLAMCDTDDLVYLNKRVDDYKRDFFALLPLEIIERILVFLDWQTILNCCQVNSVWNKKLSNCFNKLWYDLCCRELPLDDLDQDTEWHYTPDVVNYKNVFVRLMKSRHKLECGRMFRTWQLGPIEINAVATYENVIATATHRVKFWRLELLPPSPRNTTNNKNRENTEWICFKSFYLQSRASAIKFDSIYLLASTYFLSIDLYSLESQSLMGQYMGHTCSITAFDFNTRDLALICTGSADNSLKYWTLPSQTCDSSGATQLNNILSDENLGVVATNLPIRTEINLLWPVKITIEKLLNRKESSSKNGNDDEYLVLALCANGFLFINLVMPGPEISETYKSLLNLQPACETLIEFQRGFFDNDHHTEPPIISNKSWVDLRSSGLLTVYVVTENNSYQNKKIFKQQWLFRKNLDYVCFEFSPTRNNTPTLKNEQNQTNENENEDIYSFLNKRMLKTPNIGQFEVIAFGANYCLILDESNIFHLSRLSKRAVGCIQSALEFDNETTTAFRVHLNNSSQEQFVFADRRWMNGFRLSQSGSRPNDDNDDSSGAYDFVCAFFTHKRNELFIIGWN